MIAQLGSYSTEPNFCSFKAKAPAFTMDDNPIWFSDEPNFCFFEAKAPECSMDDKPIWFSDFIEAICGWYTTCATEGGD